MTKTGTKNLVSRGARAAIVGISLAALFMSCSNMLSGNDVKDKVATDVTVATATSVTVSIQANTSSGGTLSLSGAQTEKVGVAFSLTASAFDAYVFSSWSATGSGKVTFSSTAAATTKVTIGAAASDIVITANFTTRPYIKSVSPSSAVPVVINMPIIINFSKAMDPASFNVAGNLKVSFDGINPTIPNPQTIYSSGTASAYFNAPTWNSSYMQLTLYPLKTSPVTYLPQNSTITVTTSSAVTDSTGISLLANNYQEFYYTTSDKSDESAPTISSVAVMVDGSAASTIGSYSLVPGATSGNVSVTLQVSASSSAASTVQSFIFDETGDNYGSREIWETTPGYNSSLAYTFQTADQGPKQLDIYVKSSTGNKSAVHTIYLYLDRTGPSISGAMVKDHVTGNTSFCLNAAVDIYSATVNANQGTSIDGLSTISVDVTGYGISTSSLIVPSTWSSTIPAATLSGLTAEGSQTLYVWAKDKSGKQSYAAASPILVDVNGPSISSAVVADNVSGSTVYCTNAGGNVVGSSSTVATAGASGVAIASTGAYALSTSGTTAPTTWYNSVTLATLSGVAEGNTVYLWVKDAAGLTNKAASSIKTDLTGPTVSAAVVADNASGNTSYCTNAGGVVKGSSVTATAGSSGVAVASTGGYALSTSGTTAPTTGWANSIAAATLSGCAEGNTVYVWVRDLAGFANKAASTIKVDLTGPSVSAAVVADNTSGNTSYCTTGVVKGSSVTATAGTSGVAVMATGGYALSTSGTTAPTVGWANSIAAATLSGCVEGNTVYVWVKDLAGLTNRAASAMVVDLTGPTASAAVVADNTSGSTIYCTNTSGTVKGSSVTAGAGTSGVAVASTGGYALSTSGTTAPTVGWANTIATATLSGCADGSTVYVWVKDLAGLTAKAASAIIIDASGPSVSLAVVADYTGGSTTYCTSGNVIGYSVTSAAGASGVPVMTTNGFALSTSGTTAPTVGWANSASLATLSGCAEGSTIYVWVKDIAGVANKAASAIKVDLTGPSVNAAVVADQTGGSTSYCTSGNVVGSSVTALAGTSGVAVMSTGGYALSTSGTVVPTSGWANSITAATLTGCVEGNTIYVWVKDLAGLTNRAASAMIVDLTGPTASAAVVADNTGGSTAYCTSGVVKGSSITAGAGTSGVGIKATGGYALSTSGTTAPTVGWANTIATATLSGCVEGNTIWVWVKDAAGLTNKAVSSILVDINGPTVSAAVVADNTGGSTTYCTSGTVKGSSVTAAAGGSGVAILATGGYALGTSGTTAPTVGWANSVGTATLSGCADGNTVYVWVKDLAGVASKAASAIIVDTTGPSVSAAVVADNTGGSTSYCTSGTVKGSSVTAAAGGSGVAVASTNGYALSTSGTVVPTVGWANSIGTATLSGCAEGNTIYVWVRDIANVANKASASIVVDLTGPNVSAAVVADQTGGSTTYCTSGNVKGSSVTAGAGSSGVGIMATNGYALSTSGSTAPTIGWANTIAAATLTGCAEGNTIYIWVKDAAGLTNKAASAIATDLTGPSVSAAVVADNTGGSTTYCTSGVAKGSSVTAVAGTSTVAVASTGGYALSTSGTTAPTVGWANSITSATLSGCTDGNTVYVWVKDLAGLTNKAPSSIVVDTAGPNVSAAVVADQTGGSTTYCTSGNVVGSSVTSGAGASGVAVAATNGFALSTSGASAPATGWANSVTAATLSGCAEGNTVYVWVKDLAGATNKAASSIKVDLTGPAVSAAVVADQTGGSTTYCTSGDVKGSSVTAVAGTSGVAVATTGGYALSTSGASAPGTGWADTIATATLSSVTDGDTIYIWVKDLAGLTNKAASSIKVDLAGPSVSAAVVADQTGGSTTYCTSGNVKGSSVTATAGASTVAIKSTGGYALSTSGTTAPTGGWANSITLATLTSCVEGDTVYIWVKDLAGVSNKAASAIVVDTTGPNASAAVVADQTGGSTTYCTSGNVVGSSVTAGAGTSGVAIKATGGYALSTSGTTAPTIGWANSITLATLTGCSEGDTVYVWVKDAAGITNKSASAIVVDTTGPSASAAVVADQTGGSQSYITSGNAVGYSVTAGAGTSGVALMSTGGYALSTSGTTAPTIGWANSITTATLSSIADGSNVYVWVKDLAGLTNKAKSSIVVDSTKPVIYDSTSDGTKQPLYTGNTQHKLTITMKVADLSGASTIYYWNGDIAKPGTGINSKTFTALTAIDAFTQVQLPTVPTSPFSFSVADAAGNESAERYVMTGSGDSWTYTAPHSINASILMRVLSNLGIGTSKNTTASSSSSRAAYAEAVYGSADPVQKAKANEAVSEALRSDIGQKPIEVSYAVPVKARASIIDSSGISLLGRSAAAAKAAKAAGTVEARLTIPAGVSSAPNAPSSSAPAQTAAPSATASGSPAQTSGQSAPGTGTQAQSSASAPSTVPQPAQNGPQEPQRAPAGSVDLYVSQTSNKREDSSESSDEDESSDRIEEE